MLTGEQLKKLEVLKLRKELAKKLNEAFDPSNLASRPTPHQLEIISSPTPINYVVGSNRSGKSQLAGRICTWWFNGTHPYLNRPEKWGNGPLTILFMGQTQDNIDGEIWPRKIRPFIGEEGVDFKVKRSGGYIKSVQNLHNGNTIMFLTHSDAEQARRRGQGFTAHVVFIDEMPPISSIITELRLRVLTTGGWMYCTFTPLVRNDEIRKIVDNSDGVKAKKWVISILDNPVFTKEERDLLVEEFRTASGSDAEFRARMFGDWLTSGDLVFYYDSEKNFAHLDKYDPRIWPHIAVVDPAHSGLAGLNIWARHPRANVWYCVLAKYINGQAPSDLVESVEQELEMFNVVGRACDCNPSGFYKEALKAGIKYRPITDKQFNKETMIENVNQAFKENSIYLTDGARPLIDEVMTCSRNSDDPSKIIKASKYHTADCLRYFVHVMPEYKAAEAAMGRDEWIRTTHKKREANDWHTKKAKQEKETKRVKRIMRMQRKRRLI